MVVWPACMKGIPEFGVGRACITGVNQSGRAMAIGIHPD